LHRDELRRDRQYSSAYRQRSLTPQLQRLKMLAQITPTTISEEFKMIFTRTGLESNVGCTDIAFYRFIETQNAAPQKMLRNRSMELRERICEVPTTSTTFQTIRYAGRRNHIARGGPRHALQ
jgi:hypothetical protein